MSTTTGPQNYCLADREIDFTRYDAKGEIDHNPTAPNVNGWELSIIEDDCPMWEAPNGVRVEIVSLNGEYVVLANGELIDEEPTNRESAIKKAIDWMCGNEPPDSISLRRENG